MSIEDKILNSFEEREGFLFSFFAFLILLIILPFDIFVSGLTYIRQKRKGKYKNYSEWVNEMTDGF